ncbi:hypothetical protein H6501_02750 [Candidatus Woesearchaeota archaeon]|nr:hypothetical protein [Nanoarchaeota archaeon]MCB9370490.1 hypothetical protein [Candidatus Woesearchaeota archaeon]
MKKKSVVQKKTASKKEEEKTLSQTSKGNFGDFLKTFDTLSKNKLALLLFSFFLIALAMAYTYSIRDGAINLDGLENNIRSNVYSNIQNDIAARIDSEYPNLQEYYRQEAIDKEMAKVYETGMYQVGNQTFDIENSVHSSLETIKAGFKAENNQTYLTAIDPYHFLGLSSNFLKNGHTGTELKEIDGKEVPYIAYKVAPEGTTGTYNPEMHIWIEAELFKLNGLTAESSIGEKTKAVYLLPVIIAMLCVIPLFFAVRLFTGPLTAFFSSLLMVSIGTFVSRTVAGFVDTDAYNVLFPLLIAVFLFYAVHAKKVWQKATFAFFSGLSTGLFLWAWPSGWFMFIFAVAALIAYLVYKGLIFVQARNSSTFVTMKGISVLLLSYVLSSYLATYIFFKQNIFTYTYITLMDSLGSIAQISKTNIWPNVLSSVAELNPASFVDIVSSAGGKFVFVIGLMAFTLLSLDFLPKKEKKLPFRVTKMILIVFSIVWYLFIVYANLFVSLTLNSPFVFLALLFFPAAVALLVALYFENESEKIFPVLLLCVWLAGTIYMSLNGSRFILLLAPAFSIAFGFGLYQAGKLMNSFIQDEFKPKSSIGKVGTGIIVTSLVFLILFFPLKTTASAISNSVTPNFDDAWYQAMYKIRDNSEKTAIVTSWWDFGHFFAVTTERGVTFDGASQTLPQAHWVGRALMENDMDKARDILRMLVCGGNEAFDVLYAITKDNTGGIKVNKLISDTFGKTLEEKKEILKNYKYYEFTDSEIEEVLDKLYCENPPQDFVVASGDMIGKAGVWAHWGSWNFTKKYVHDQYTTKTPEQIASALDEDPEMITQLVAELKKIDSESESEDVSRSALVNNWLAPYPSYIPLQGKYEYACQQNNVTLLCQNGLIINLENGSVQNTALSQEITFRRIVYPSYTGSLEEISLDENGIFDILLIPRGTETFGSMIMQYPLGMSLFTRLYFLEGYGSEHFELFDSVQSQTGIGVKVYSVNWTNPLVSEQVANNALTLDLSDGDNAEPAQTETGNDEEKENETLSYEEE